MYCEFIRYIKYNLYTYKIVCSTALYCCKKVNKWGFENVSASQTCIVRRVTNSPKRCFYLRHFFCFGIDLGKCNLCHCLNYSLLIIITNFTPSCSTSVTGCLAVFATIHTTHILFHKECSVHARTNSKSTRDCVKGENMN